MKISIIGCGYVGIVTGACLAEQGHEITLVDLDIKKIDVLMNGKSPIFEPNLDIIIQKNQGKILATTNLESAIFETDISIITVGTPSKRDGSIDLTFIKKVCSDVGCTLRKKDNYHLVIVKSTVLPGTTENIIIPIIEQNSKKEAGIDFGIIVNPEFLSEGNAIEDYFNPDRIVIGFQDHPSKENLTGLFREFTCPILYTSYKTAEMIKYVNNSFLATKISFSNEIGNLCKVMGIDSYEVFKGVGMDKRINPNFFRAGIGFGGSCFPKDLRALISFMSDNCETPQLLMATVSVNEGQPRKMISLLKKHIPDLSKKRIGVLGLSFKPETDDIRESRALPIVKYLLESGAEVVAYDPMGIDNFKVVFKEIEYAPASKVLECDAVLILTEWSDFEKIDYSGKIVIDGRRIEAAKKTAFIYEGICW